jgi:hypothetical protein
MNTTGIGEKEILEIETLKQSLAMDMRRFDIEQQKINIEIAKKGYEGWRLAMYGIAVGLGGTFAIAKTISLLGWVG